MSQISPILTLKTFIRDEIKIIHQHKAKPLNTCCTSNGNILLLVEEMFYHLNCILHGHSYKESCLLLYIGQLLDIIKRLYRPQTWGNNQNKDLRNKL